MRAARCRGANTFVFILHQKSKKLNQRGLPGPRLWPPMPAARPQLPPRSPHSRAVFSHVSSLSWEHRQPGFCAPKNSVSQPSADEAWNRAPFFHLMNRLKKKKMIETDRLSLRRGTHYRRPKGQDTNAQAGRREFILRSGLTVRFFLGLVTDVCDFQHRVPLCAAGDAEDLQGDWQARGGFPRAFTRCLPGQSGAEFPLTRALDAVTKPPRTGLLNKKHQRGRRGNTA